MRKKTTINYLSNSELLFELNKSKKTYCYFIDEKYGDYTVIVNSLDEIDDELIEQAKIEKAKQINNNNQRKLIKSKIPRKEISEEMDKIKISVDDVKKEDLVFRVMTFEHIPEYFMEPKKTLMNRLKFPPFKHYAFIDGELKEVGRSQWKNGLGNGEFSIDHGKISDQLVLSVMKIVDRFGTKGSYSGYSYLSDMKSQALLQLSVVMLQFDESKSLNPFAYFSQSTKLSFWKILKEEKKQRVIKDDLMNSELGISSHAFQMDNEEEL